MAASENGSATNGGHNGDPQSSPKKPFHIAIVGGGITGLTLAMALQRRGVPCTLYEQASAFGEIGAGVGMACNAVRALEACDPTAIEGFRRIASTNKWPSKEHVWMEFVDGASTHETGSSPDKDDVPVLCTITSPPPEHAGVHRAHFVHEIETLLTPAVGKQLGKRLERACENPETGRVRLEFRDGTTAEADAVVGCDGIKSRTREIMFGKTNPVSRYSYTHKYAYRALIPMEDAVRVVGEERASNICAWTGPNRHVISFPISNGTIVNLVGFVDSEAEWPSEERLTLPATREEMLHDFREFGPKLRSLISLIKSKPDKWGIFDLGEHPVPTFYKGRIALLGDAAHASSPHCGAGAALGLEDCAVLAELLADKRVHGGPGQLEAVFAAYDACRRERDQWLVNASRRAGDLYEWKIEGIGRDGEKMRAEISERQGIIWNYDIHEATEKARADLTERLAALES